MSRGRVQPPSRHIAPVLVRLWEVRRKRDQWMTCFSSRKASGSGSLRCGPAFVQSRTRIRLSTRPARSPGQQGRGQLPTTGSRPSRKGMQESPHGHPRSRHGRSATTLARERSKRRPSLPSGSRESWSSDRRVGSVATASPRRRTWLSRRAPAPKRVYINCVCV